jgi:hypothetical protein
MKRLIVGMISLVATTPWPARAETLEQALAVYAAKNYAEAARLFRPLAEGGDTSAQSYLAFMYKSGQGVDEDDGEAVRWYRQAAERGYALAQYSLGTLYDKGEGVAPDFVQAHKWFSVAAARFPAADHEHREKAIKARDLVAAKMTPAQIAEAERLARAWMPVE